MLSHHCDYAIIEPDTLSHAFSRDYFRCFIFAIAASSRRQFISGLLRAFASDSFLYCHFHAWPYFLRRAGHSGDFQADFHFHCTFHSRFALRLRFFICAEAASLLWFIDIIAEVD